jgi:hypothetical protein
MNVRIKLSALRETRWHEYLTRFVFGGLATVCAGAIASLSGPEIGGLFLAFPAVFCASATLMKSTSAAQGKGGRSWHATWQRGRGFGCGRRGLGQLRTSCLRRGDLAAGWLFVMARHPCCLGGLVCRLATLVVHQTTDMGVATTELWTMVGSSSGQFPKKQGTSY